MKGSTEYQEQMDLKACRKTHQSSSSCLNLYIRQKGKGGQKTSPALPTAVVLAGISPDMLLQCPRRY